MINVRASVLEERLNVISKMTGKTKSHFVRMALQTYLDGLSIDPLPYERLLPNDECGNKSS